MDMLTALIPAATAILLIFGPIAAIHAASIRFEEDSRPILAGDRSALPGGPWRGAPSTGR